MSTTYMSHAMIVNVVLIWLIGMKIEQLHLEWNMHAYVLQKCSKTRVKWHKQQHTRLAKKLTAPSIPRRSPIQVLTGPDVA